MAFKLVLFVAVCLAQGFALDPLRLLQRSELRSEQRIECSHQGASFVSEMEQVMNEMDAFREEVSLAAMEAYAKGKDLRIAVTCFAVQGPRFAKMGVQLAKKMTEASLEIAGKAAPYAKRMKEPVRALTITFATVPVKVYQHIENKEFLKAAKLMLEARKVIVKNSIILGEIFTDFVNEYPEMADRVEFLSKDIYNTARTNSRELREAYGKCVEQGGPKRPVDLIEGSSEE